MKDDEKWKLIYDNKNALLNHCIRKFNNEFQSYEVEDLVHTGLLKAYLKFDQFNSDKSKLKTWLYTIVYRVCIDEIRNKKKFNNLIEQIYQEEICFIEEDLELDLFEDSLKDENLIEFFKLRKDNLDFSIEGEVAKKSYIMEKLNLTTKEYNLKMKQLKRLWNEFNE